MPSFDIVNKVNAQEVDNAFQQARKEIEQRYDFKGTDTNLEKKDKEQGIQIRSSTEQRLEAAREVLMQKLAKRGVSLRGVKTEKAKAIVKLIKDSKLKVQASIQGDSVRVSGKSRDDLQSVMQLVRGKQDELGVDTQFENFRD